MFIIDMTLSLSSLYRPCFKKQKDYDTGVLYLHQRQRNCFVPDKMYVQHCVRVFYICYWALCPYFSPPFFGNHQLIGKETLCVSTSFFFRCCWTDVLADFFCFSHVPILPYFLLLFFFFFFFALCTLLYKIPEGRQRRWWWLLELSKTKLCHRV